MPRVLSLLEIFSSSSVSSIDHFMLVTSHRDMILELLAGLTQACAALERSAPPGGPEASLKAAMERYTVRLGSVADSGNAVVVAQPQLAADTFKSGRRSPTLADLVEGFGYSQLDGHTSAGSSSRADSWQLFDSQSVSPAVQQPLEPFSELAFQPEQDVGTALHPYMPSHPYSFEFPHSTSS
jgi:hypothetical protein